jgi:hypothetical protein
MMFKKQVRGQASPGRRWGHGSLANKRAADVRARALASILREIQAIGFIGRRAQADELNRRGVPTVRGGRWHRTTVERMLKRLGLLTWGVGARIRRLGGLHHLYRHSLCISATRYRSPSWDIEYRPRLVGE